MPSSASEAIPYILEFMRELVPKPKRILDVGMGFGKFGFLIREYYEAKEFQRFEKKDWKIDLIGVEIFEDYISELQKLIYNKIIIGDVFDNLNKLGNFDIILLIDILDHLEKERGLKLIEKLFKHTDNILISSPHGFKEHKAIGKNIFEEHKSGWTLKDFEKYKIVKSKIIPRIRRKEEVIVVFLQK